MWPDLLVDHAKRLSAGAAHLVVLLARQPICPNLDLARIMHNHKESVRVIALRTRARSNAVQELGASSEAIDYSLGYLVMGLK